MDDESSDATSPARVKWDTGTCRYQVLSFHGKKELRIVIRVPADYAPSLRIFQVVITHSVQ